MASLSSVSEPIVFMESPNNHFSLTPHFENIKICGLLFRIWMNGKLNMNAMVGKILKIGQNYATETHEGLWLYFMGALIKTSFKKQSFKG